MRYARMASVTCLNVSAGSNQLAANEAEESAAGIDPELLDEALVAVNASLVDIHKVVAQALAEDFQRRTALTSSAGQQ